MMANNSKKAELDSGRLRWTYYLLPFGRQAARPLVSLEIGALVVCLLALLWKHEAAAAHGTIPMAFSAVMGAVAAGQESKAAARHFMWVAAIAMWLVAAMIGLKIAGL